MTDFVKELLEDVQIGDRVRLTYGAGDDKTTGTVCKLTDNFITLVDENGLQAKIKVDLLTAVEELPKLAEAAPAPKPAEVAPAPKPALRSFVALPEHTVYAYDPEQWLEKLNGLRRGNTSREVAAQLDGVVSSFRAARKANSLPSKYHTLRMKTLKLWDSCDLEADYRCFYLLLGMLALEAEDYYNAYEPLVRAKEYALASCAAGLAKDTKKEALFQLCALLHKEAGVQVDKLVATSCVQRTDVSVLSALLKAYQEDGEVCERIAACAEHIRSSLGEKAPIVKLDADAEPVIAAKALIAAMPQSFQIQSALLRDYEEYEGYIYPSPEKTDDDGVQDYEGTIEMYDVNGKWGFICPDPDSGIPLSGKIFFHITQVPSAEQEDILLRRLLMAGRGQGLKVSFYIGQSRQISWRGKPAATNIILTIEGLDEAKRRLDTPKEGILTGFIMEDTLDRQRESGMIQYGNKRCSFHFSAIMDPYLRAYCKNSFAPTDQEVSFSVVKGGAGQHMALDICWRNPSQRDVEMYRDDVSQEEAENWKPLQTIREQELQGVPDLGDAAYRRDPFFDLPDWVPLDKRSTKSLTWPVAVPVVQPAAKSAPAHAEKQEKVVFVKVDDNGPGKSSVDAARKAMQDNDLETAESWFLQALEQGASPDTVLGDLMTLYLRQPEKLEGALALLDRYENQLPPEKLLNLRVSAYEKLKKHEVLCELFEEVFRVASSVSRKSHALWRLAGSHQALGQHDKTLQVCRRWEQLYQQNRYGTDAAKLRSMSSGIDRLKAISYYHTGQLEEARRIAVELVRSNPADTTANAILAGNLAAVQPNQDESNALELLKGMETGEKTSQMPPLVSLHIHNVDVSEVLKTKNIKDKQYVGSVRQAKDDISALNAKTGNTPKSRSTNLFAMCHIAEEVESRENSVIWNPNEVHRWAGRAMASLGDYLVSVSDQMDTARMAYLYSIQMLPPYKGDEQDMINSYNRYLKSYFMGRSELSKYIDQQNTSSNKDGLNTDVFITHQLPEVLIPEYFVGMVQLFAALTNLPHRQKQLTTDIYSRNEKLRRMVIRQMSLFLGDTADEDSLNIASFHERFQEAERLLRAQTEVVSQALGTIGAQLLEHPIEESDLSNIGSTDWHRNLCATDFSRLQKLYYILLRTQDYYIDVDFESRADCLRAAFSESKELLENIQREPTELSYEAFLPALSTIIQRISACRDALYREHQPRLSWRESIQPFKTRDGAIQIQLLVKNAPNCQAADMLRIEPVIEGDVVRFLTANTLITLRGGEEREMILTLDITEEAKQAGNFCVELCYSYRRSRDDHSIEQVSQEQTFTLVLRSEDFVQLKNPFKDHIGKFMSDANMFYGRRQQLQQMVEMICPPGSDRMNYGRAIAMYGQTRTGKSSLLYHFSNRLQEQYGDRVIIWDMGNIADLNMNVDAGSYLQSFLYKMLDVGTQALENHDILCDCVEEAELEAPLTEILLHPQHAVLHFTTYMRKLNRILKEQNCIIVLFVDEFTYLHGLIRQNQLSGEFMKFWKAFLQDYCVFAVIAAQDDMPEFMRKYPNEFACMEAMKVTYLDEIPAKQLICEPLERANGREDIFRNDGCVDELYRLTAGSTYLTMLLCSNLVNYLNEKGASTVTRGIVADYLEKKVLSAKTFLEEQDFEPQIRERGHEDLEYVNKQLLHSIARLSQANGRADVSRITCTNEKGEALSAEEIQQLLDRLVVRNVLISEAGDRYWIPVKLLELWLISTMGG